MRMRDTTEHFRDAGTKTMLELLEDCKQAMGVRTIVGLAFTGQVQSPSLFGCLRPRILLPEHLADRIPLEELRCIFLHELAHLKRGDLWLSWLVAVLQALHWFNPLIWWAFARMRADRDAASDALALRRMPDGGSERYADTIVNLLESYIRSRRLPVVAAIVENRTQIERRLTRITQFKPPSRIASLLAAALVTLLATATLTDAQEIAVVPAQKQIAGSPPAYIPRDPLRVGAAVQASRLVSTTEPVYPENGRRAGIAGETEFEVTVHGEGKVIDIWSVAGHPLLADAAAEAIRQWRYLPTLLNDTPVAVTFTVVVDFLPDGTVATAFKSRTQPPRNQFLNIVVPSSLDNAERHTSGVLVQASTGFRTFEGRRYLLMGEGMTAAVVDVDIGRLRELADAEGSPMLIRVFINKNGGIDGIAQEYGPKIPAIDDMLMHMHVQSPAMFGTEPVPSHVRIDIHPADMRELQFVRPFVIGR